MSAFSRGIAADSYRYALTPADAEAISKAVEEYRAALPLAKDPETSTLVTVARKDDARRSAEQICRLYYSLIKPSAGISDADKIAIGVRPLNRGRSPITCPASSPLLKLLGQGCGFQVLRFSDSATPTSPSKPFGATELLHFVAITDERGVGERDPANAKFYGKFSRNPVDVRFEAKDDGRVATHFARWASRRGEVGPWSLPVSMRIAA